MSDAKRISVIQSMSNMSMGGGKQSQARFPRCHGAEGGDDDISKVWTILNQDDLPSKGKINKLASG